MTYTIQANAVAVDVDYKPRGGCEEFFYSHAPEIVVHGPAQSGKTLAACWKSHLLCALYPGCQGAIVRKTERSLHGSVLQTFQNVIDGAPVKIYGGEHPTRYIYANGSTIWLGGLDNPDKILSSERDFIYANQVEEFTINDWEMLLTRVTGRSAVIPNHMVQLFGDCNPGRSKHWILERAKNKLKLILSFHADNPTLYTDDGQLTELGKRTFEILDSLTGVRYQRLRLGKWTTAEGVVYDTFDNNVHVHERDIADFGRWFLAMDEGYTNPAVILLIGEDGDGRWHIHREFYERGKLQAAVVEQAAAWYTAYSCELAAVDASAAGLIADLRDVGINAVAAKGRVLDGIQSIQNRMRVQDDGRPRLTIQPSCVNVINEFESYVWKPEKDEPVKENDHALDALRYLANALAGESDWLLI